MTPSEAVTLRAHAAEGIHRYYNKATRKKLDQMTIGAAALEVQTVLTAPLYTWRDDLLTAALVAAKALPGPVTFKADLMPTPSGVYLFNRDVSFDGVGKPICAVAWGQIAHLVFFWAYIKTVGTTWSNMGPMGAYASFGVADGVDVVNDRSADFRKATTDESFAPRTGPESVVRFVLASWLWMKQRVMLPQPVNVSTSASKSAERAGAVAACNVVILRRSDDSCQSDGSGEAKEFSCQWLVRGHWRQQFYPSTGEHRPLWIEPYVKGPDDKPFKLPTQTVFAVSR
jgi:hypothetical protein